MPRLAFARAARLPPRAPPSKSRGGAGGNLSERLPPGAHALVVCVGKKCAPRAESEALFERMERRLEARGGGAMVVRAKGLGICEDGPIVASLPDGKVVEQAGDAEADRMLGRLIDRD
jgi:NADH:ubiquinone oxidoreductase subunit E